MLGSTLTAWCTRLSAALWCGPDTSWPCYRCCLPPRNIPRYGAKFTEEYISSSVTAEALCVGEYWADLKWDGSELAPCQDAARQHLCDWINGAGKACTAFDFPTKGILQVCCAVLC
jgi:hypothetical protein